ncbi:hypothetical protein JCM10049v2_002331 [Rhodotorula toruloides]
MHSPAASTSSVTLDHSPAPTPSPSAATPSAAPPSPANSPAPAASSQDHAKRKRTARDKDALRYALTSGFAGGIAGCVAKTSVAPLDRVKILFQTHSPDYQKYAGQSGPRTWTGVFKASKAIYAETGVRGLLQGHSATLIRIFPYAAIKFMAYDELHRVLMPTPEAETSGRRFLAGSLAGIITTGFTYPLELIRVRLAFESHHSPKDRASLLRTIRAIYQNPPPPASSSSSAPPPQPSPSPVSSSCASTRPTIAHFYRGVWPTLVGIIPYAGTSFLMWGFLKTDLFPSIFSPTFRRQNRALLDLLAGGVAGAIGQTTAYPLDIVRRRMQVGPVLHADGRGRAGFWETAKGVYRQGGWRGFFVGLSIGYLKVVPMNAVSFATWVAMKRVLGMEETPGGGNSEAKKEEGEGRAPPDRLIAKQRAGTMSADIWDDDGWEDMPVLRSSSTEPTASIFDSDLRDVDDASSKKRSAGPAGPWNAPAPAKLLDSPVAPGYSSMAGASATGNATGRLVDVGEKGATAGLREKGDLDEMDYTRLELDDDPDEDEISMRTQYLFNEDTSMTPLSQMQQTKTLLTEGQRIAYVGLCRLVAREMVQTLALAAKGAKELDPAKESCKNWANKIMGRLYRHMDVDSAEQRMIEQLAEHGVTAEDLVPSLVATYTVDNPDYDPEAAEAAAKEADIALEAETARRTAEAEQRREEEPMAHADDVEERLGDLALGQEDTEAEPHGYVKREVRKIERRTSEATLRSSPQSPRSPRTVRSPPETPSKRHPSAFDDFDDGGDIGSALDDPPAKSPSPPPDYPPAPEPSDPPPIVEPTTPKASASALPAYDELDERKPDNFLQPLPSSLPGVTQNLSSLDKTVTLDIRWTILCDLFLSLIADSVYDARSRVLLGKMAEKLGLEWLDVVRFERRLTEALEIQEAVKDKEHEEVLEGRRLKDKHKRYLMMGLATVGGGLVIGLSAGLLAPVIGAGLGAALTTVGVTGTSGFLAGAGGAAIISSGATLTGATIGGKAMARRTRHVKTFDIQPLHNNKRVNLFITVPGFMNGPRDDVRLPFSTIDPVVGDVLSVLWEPEMMGDTGNALKILASEVLTQAGQQVLAATVMTALMSALQWPMMLTKLSYLIDNPWSNALDRARQAGAILADILINRRLGVRPVSLVGFSLGARVIFFALVELAKANAFGVVQEVYLFGATVTASNKVWRQVRGIVAGRFVNGFAMNDWVLGYLFRATTGGLQTVAGLRPIEHVPDLENVDITHLLDGHTTYRSRMPKLLAYVGFKVTADHFDEPDLDPEAPDREVLTKEQEEERRLKKEKKGLGIFRRKKAGGTDSTPMSRAPSIDEYDLPPRLSSSSSTSLNKILPGVSTQGGRSSSSLSVATSGADVEATEEKQAPSPSAQSEQAQAAAVESPQAPASPAVPSGFDLAKLRDEVAQLPKPSPERAASLPPQELPTVASTSSAARAAGESIQRTPSAPPPVEQPRTDLRELDQELDPRELLRRQWNGEAVPAAASALPPVGPPAESAWASDTSLPDDHYASPTFSFPSAILTITTSASDAPSFTFGDSNGFVHPSLDDRTPTHDMPSFTFGSSASFNDAASFTFGASDGSLEPWAKGDSAKKASDDAPDPAGSFVWGGGGGGGRDNASSTTLSTQNPW